MNDRAVSLLEQYDVEILETRKGRDAIVCDTPSGSLILREYRGQKERLTLQNKLLFQIREQGFMQGEVILPTKDGELYVKDREGVDYILKTYPDGRECNILSETELEEVVTLLAKLHQVMPLSLVETDTEKQEHSVFSEYEKKNRELARVRKYLRKKSQKNGFELALSQVYDSFLEQALEVTASWQNHLGATLGRSAYSRCTYCHGDFQYHNLLYKDGEWFIINFEKFILDYPVRDLYLLLRKVMEKNDWSIELGKKLLGAYEKESPLSEEGRLDLYFRLSYPEKFRKIVNCYFNTGKVFVSGKNVEKLEKILAQENQKQQFLKEFLLS